MKRGYWFSCRYHVEDEDEDYDSKKPDACRLYRTPCMHNECLLIELERRINQLEEREMVK